MRGHENIVAMRLQGLKPAGHVSLTDGSIPAKHLRWEYPEDARHPAVCTDGDPVEALDLRFLIGLAVHIRGDNQNRIKQLAAKARAAGAEMVACFVGDKAAIWTKGDTAWRTF